jgi:hypothetical protein
LYSNKNEKSFKKFLLKNDLGRYSIPVASIILNELLHSEFSFVFSLSNGILFMKIISLFADIDCAIDIYLLTEADERLGIPESPQNKILMKIIF